MVSKHDLYQRHEILLEEIAKLTEVLNKLHGQCDEIKYWLALDSDNDICNVSKSKPQGKKRGRKPGFKVKKKEVTSET